MKKVLQDKRYSKYKLEFAQYHSYPFTFLAPKIVIYDNACNLQNYCLNRDPLFFKNTLFLVDRFHWKKLYRLVRIVQHYYPLQYLMRSSFLIYLACAATYNTRMYTHLKYLNTEINEQQNAAVKRLKNQVSYMTAEHFISHCDLFFFNQNIKKKKLLWILFLLHFGIG